MVVFALKKWKGTENVNLGSFDCTIAPTTVGLPHYPGPAWHS